MSSFADDFPKFLPGDQWHLDQTTGSTDSLCPASRIYTRKNKMFLSSNLLASAKGSTTSNVITHSPKTFKE